MFGGVVVGSGVVVVVNSGVVVVVGSGLGVVVVVGLLIASLNILLLPSSYSSTSRVSQSTPDELDVYLMNKFSVIPYKSGKHSSSFELEKSKTIV